MSRARETQDTMQQPPAKNQTGSKILPFPLLFVSFSLEVSQPPLTALLLATGWRAEKAPCSLSAWPMWGTTRHTLF